MNVADFMDEKMIVLDTIQATDKMDMIRQLANYMAVSKKVVSKKDFIDEVIKREEIESTGIGNGLAFPHARTDSVNGIVVAFARSRDGINFKAIDDKPVHIFFLIGTPKKEVSLYLKLLAQISRLMKKEENRKRLLEARDSREVLQIIREIN
jgi:PTS system fructose-specific IIA component/PTS system nitrogen regulatory IIA component